MSEKKSKNSDGANWVALEEDLRNLISEGQGDQLVSDVISLGPH